MSYFLFGTLRTAGVDEMVPIVVPCRVNTHEAPDGLVTTLISCDVPSKTVAQPDSITAASATAQNRRYIESPSPRTRTLKHIQFAMKRRGQAVLRDPLDSN